MKIKCGQKEFENALNIAMKAVTQNSALPVLNNVLLSAEGSKLVISGTNLEVAVQSFIDADIEEDGSITIPARLLLAYVSLVNSETLEMSVDSSNNLVIKAGNDETKIKGISSDEFPIIPVVDKENVFVVKRKDFDIAITRTVFAAAGNTARPVLSGVLFSVSGGKLTMVATDSFRLAEKQIDLNQMVDFDISVIVPARTVSELGKIVNKSDVDEIEINVSKNQILFSIADTKMVSRLIEGKFPDYQKIIPVEGKTKIVVKTSELNLVVRRVALFARENNNNVKISVDPEGSMVVSTDETKVGEEKAIVIGKVDGVENIIALNSQFLLDVLNCISSDETQIELNDKLSPAVIRIPKEGEEKYMYIIMPLKI